MKRIFFLLLISSSLNSFSQQESAAKRETIPWGNNPKAGHYVQSGDAKIYYEIYGKGAPIVILHGGIVGSIEEMHQFIDSLSNGYQVIAVSTRGHGKSEIGKGPITYEMKANDIMAVVNDVTKDSVIILGFSDGAYTGYKIASMYPARVKKLIAIGAGEQMPGLRKVSFDATDAMRNDNLFWKQKRALMPEPQRLPEFWKMMQTFYNSMEAGKALFNSIKCPVLVMSGENDMNALLASVIATYQMIPNSQLSIIPNAPHPVFMVNFPAVWYSIVPFLKQ